MYLLKIKFLHQKRVCYLKHNEAKFIPSQVFKKSKS